VALLRNAAGEFVAPDHRERDGGRRGGHARRCRRTSDYRVSIVNAPGARSYPVASFSWMLVNAEQPDSAKGRMIVDFLRWALANGASSARALGYAPLPPAVAARLDSQLDAIQPGASRSPAR
jgi:phosphate transport system substrate-binding protein